MTTEETALADKILKEATECKLAGERANLIRQYNDVVCAAMNRREATEPRRELGCATKLSSTQPAE
jgi:hypothetical protein